MKNTKKQRVTMNIILISTILKKLMVKKMNTKMITMPLTTQPKLKTASRDISSKKKSNLHHKALSKLSSTTVLSL